MTPRQLQNAHPFCCCCRVAANAKSHQHLCRKSAELLCLSCRDTALSAYQAKNAHLAWELLSFRSQCYEMDGFATFTRQHETQTSRCDSLSCNTLAPSAEYSRRLSVYVQCRMGSRSRRASSVKQHGRSQQTNTNPREVDVYRVSSLYCHWD